MSIYNYNINYSLFDKFERELIFQYKIMPLQYKDLLLLIATSDKNLEVNQISSIFNYPVKLIQVPHQELQFEWRYYDLKRNLFNKANSLNYKNNTQHNIEIKGFMDILLEFVIDNSVSDIHLEALEDSFIIRLRIDGTLYQYFRCSKEVYPIVGAYVKYLSNLDISQKRQPQNSRFSYKLQRREYDIRVSTIPTINGESIVLRVLNNIDTQRGLIDIGFSDLELKQLKHILSLKQGLFLVTGPTGSGKTTTLYSMIKDINSLDKKIITIEDPVEYKIEGIMQVNIDEDINLDYHAILKNILRQDPDILLIGEIRDYESLRIAIQASLTGHLVLATLHTNSSIETLWRLFDLGAEPYLVAATLKGVLAQRLVRVLCDSCKVKNGNEYQKTGCKNCGFTGYKNRQVVCEVLYIDKEIKSLIKSDMDQEKLEKHLKKIGFQTLEDNCRKLVDRGVTSYEEYLTKL